MKHIYMKAEFPKFFGYLVVSAVKETTVHSTSKYQIATKPGHRPQENLCTANQKFRNFLAT